MKIQKKDMFEKPSVGLKIPDCKIKTIEEDGSIGECKGLGFEFANSEIWKQYELNEGLKFAKERKEKTIKVLLNKLKNPTELETLRFGTADEKRKVLNKYRKNKKVPEIFEIIVEGFNDSSVFVRSLCKKIGTVVALDMIYNGRGHFQFCSEQSIAPMCDFADNNAKIMMSSSNAQALRNRYRMVYQIFTDHVLNSNSQRYKILSVACGSAQVIIHAIHELQKKHKIRKKFELHLLDVNQRALRMAEYRLTEAFVDAEVKYVNAPFWRIGKLYNRSKFDFVETCGLSDYLSDALLIFLLKNILIALKSQGTGIVSNIAETKRSVPAVLMEDLLNWWMRYRSPYELWHLIKRRVKANQVRVFSEPWNIHSVAMFSNEMISYR